MMAKRGLVGGYLLADDFGYFDEEQNVGREEIIFVNEDNFLKSHINIRIRVHKSEGIIEYYFYGRPAKLGQDGKAFYKSLLELKLKGYQFLSEKTYVVTPEGRVNDAWKAGIILAMENFEGREWPRRPKYGSRGYAAEIHDTFPPATIVVANFFLDWSLMREGKDVVRYLYITNYVKKDGTFRYYALLLTNMVR